MNLSAKVEDLRKAFPVLESVTYLNPGTYGPLPMPVANTLREWYTMLEHEGPWAPPAVKRSQDAYEATRCRVAALLGADPDEIALTRSVTDGTDTVAFGLAWQPGDEIIISDQEHESGWVNWQLVAKRYGVQVKIVELTADCEQLLARLDALMSPRTRLVFLSHVSCKSGLVIPAAEVCRLVHDRGALVLLDGAHAVGQMPVDVRALGCDFYTGCGHKWLMAPQGTGFLYISADKLDQVEPTWVGWGCRSKECTGPGDERLIWAEGNRRFENSTRPWALYAALGTAIDLINDLGVENIHAYVQSLVAPFKQEVAELPGMEVLTPMAASGSAGLVGLSCRGYDHQILSTLYDERRILVPYNRRDDGSQWMRFAIAYFVTRSEMDMMLDILRAAAPKA